MLRASMLFSFNVHDNVHKFCLNKNKNLRNMSYLTKNHCIQIPSPNNVTTRVLSSQKSNPECERPKLELGIIMSISIYRYNEKGTNTLQLMTTTYDALAIAAYLFVCISNRTHTSLQASLLCSASCSWAYCAILISTRF